VKLRGRTTTPDRRRGRTLSPGARGAKPLMPHGPLQGLLDGAAITGGIRQKNVHCPAGGCQSSILLPSGSMTHPNFPYSESSVFSSTLQPSLRSA
jgi:hypothetical protein